MALRRAVYIAAPPCWVSLGRLGLTISHSARPTVMPLDSGGRRCLYARRALVHPAFCSLKPSSHITTKRRGGLPSTPERGLNCPSLMAHDRVGRMPQGM